MTVQLRKVFYIFSRGIYGNHIKFEPSVYYKRDGSILLENWKMAYDFNRFSLPRTLKECLTIHERFCINPLHEPLVDRDFSCNVHGDFGHVSALVVVATGPFAML